MPRTRAKRGVVQPLPTGPRLLDVHTRVEYVHPQLDLRKGKEIHCFGCNETYEADRQLNEGMKVVRLHSTGRCQS